MSFLRLPRHQPPITRRSIQRLLLLNCICLAWIAAAAIFRGDLVLLALAALPFGPTLGMYFSLGDYGLKGAPPRDASEQDMHH
ncbi:hypothetical protein [Melaminivora jejuensis]|uniref:hypothetical protein n=1 Tax=Melaminivora jejuensis TaxID=1267217 RepID=UPI001AE00C95|nr:hypothetical protein [Melaminivora jejuensis]UHJ63979.1 hypothetical protein LVC68_11370 [Melaminivora jejuensis]